MEPVSWWHKQGSYKKLLCSVGTGFFSVGTKPVGTTGKEGMPVKIILISKPYIEE